MQVIGEVETVEASEHQRVRDRVAAGHPMVIKGQARAWTPFRRWSRAWLIERFGDVRVEHRRSPSNVHPLISPDGVMLQSTNEAASLSEYLALVASTAKVFLDANLVCLSSRRGRVNEDLVALLDDVERPAFIPEEELDTIGLWMSGRGVQTRLHYDRNGRHNFNAQLRGRKRFVLVPPSEIDKLYPFPITAPIYNFTQVDNFDPDLERYPRYAEAQGYQGLLDEGDVLFLPAFWYHSFVHEGDFNLNLNFWSDAAGVTLGPAALRNELATIVLSSIPPSEQDRAPWAALLQILERRCLQWSPQRATLDELRSGPA